MSPLLLSTIAAAADSGDTLEVLLKLHSGSISCNSRDFEGAQAVWRWFTEWNKVEELTIKIVDSDGWDIPPAIEGGYQVIEVTQGEYEWLQLTDALRSSADTLSWFDTEVVSDHGSRTFRNYIGGGMTSEVVIWDREDLDVGDLLDGFFYGQLKASCSSMAPDHFMEVEVGTFSSYLYTFSSSGTATSETFTDTYRGALGVVPCDGKTYTFNISGYLDDPQGGDELWVSLHEKNETNDRFSCDSQRIPIPGYDAWAGGAERIEQWRVGSENSLEEKTEEAEKKGE